MNLLAGVGIWAWETAPEPHALDGYDFALVKAGNGNGHTAPDGFDFRANFTRWDAMFPGRCIPWTWLYATTNGTAAADELLASAPHARIFVHDTEGDDPSRRPVPAAVVEAFAARIRAKRPGAFVGFTSYPTRAQATAHGAPWDAMVASCDFGLPQVYFASQAQRIGEVIADHQGKPVYPALSPGDWPDWRPSAQSWLNQHGAVSLWRHPDTDRWRNLLRAPAPAPPLPLKGHLPMGIARIPGNGHEWLVKLGDNGQYVVKHLSPPEADFWRACGVGQADVDPALATQLGVS